MLDREKRPRCCGRVGNTEGRGQDLEERARSRLGGGQSGQDRTDRTVWGGHWGKDEEDRGRRTWNEGQGFGGQDGKDSGGRIG